MVNRERMRGGQSRTKGRACAAWAFGLLVLTAAGAGETTWIGPAEGGSWHEVGNWSAGVPTADSIVQIDVQGEMTISAASGRNATLRSLRATGEGTLTLAQSGNGLSFGKDADGRCGIDVAPGVTVVSLMSFQSASQNLLPHFVKTGEGLLVLGNGTVTPAFGRNSGWKFAGADVAGGTLRIAFASHTDGFDPGKPAILHVGAGATLDVQAMNCLVNWARLDVADGGLVNFNGKADVIGGFSGAGVVTNINAVLQCTLQDGPYHFTGRLHGTSEVQFVPHQTESSSNTTARAVCPPEQAHFIVGPEALANLATVRTPDAAIDYPQILQFAAGYPAGTVFKAGQIAYPAAHALVLEDEEGQPVAVRADVRETGTSRARRIAGSGTFIHGAGTLYTTNALVANTGAFAVDGADTLFQLGDGQDAAADAVVAASEIRLSGNATLAAKNLAPLTLPRVAGTGRVSFQSASGEPDGNTLTFDDLSLTNGTLSSPQTCPRFVVNGGVSTNLTLQQGGATGMVLTVNGGFLHITGGTMSGAGARRFYQTGGHVVTEKPLTGWADDQNPQPKGDEIFYYMSGGVVESYTKLNYGRGLGADLSGNACMKLRQGLATYQPHRLSSDGKSFQIKIADDAVLDVDELNFATGENAGGPAGYHGYLWLNGGTLRVEKNIYFNYAAKDFPNGFDGRVYFNGGLVEALRTTPATWFNSKAVTGYVGAGGLRLDTAMDDPASALTLDLPLLHDPACGDAPDGGVDKTGRGTLLTRGDATYTGPTRVTGGTVREEGAATSTPFGTGSVALDDGGLCVTAPQSYTIASAEGAALSYDGVSSLGGYGTDAVNAVLTVGPLARKNKGVLLLGSSAPKTTPGENITVKTTGAMPLAASGLPLQPIFGYVDTTGLYAAFSFLTYDAARGFTAAACADDPATAGADALVQISTTARTLTADAQIAGLDLRYRNGTSGERGLVIGTGRTLTIGNGTGYAPLLLNGTSGGSSTPHQSIEGGTIDFGAAEGLVLSGANNNYGAWRANKITSVLTGSGGVTFAGGISLRQRMQLELHGANTWTGGTTIEALCVKPMAQGALAAGPVVVHGTEAHGGGIWIPATSKMTELPNALVLAGRGHYAAVENAVREGDYGALCADRPVTVSGAVSLAGDTLVRARNSTTTLAFTGGLSGEGRLTAAGNGVVRLGAGNTFTGGVRIEGTVECDASDAFGTGPVEIAEGACLRFTNAQPIALPNDISGAGTIVFAGAAPVTFTGANAFEGRVHGAGALAGAQTAFVKDDPGDAWLTAENTYGGETRVNAGTLLLGRPPAGDALPYAEAVTARMDASAEGTVTTEEIDGTVYVTEIRDADGRALAWSNAAKDGDAAALPTLSPAAINGRDTLFFDGSRDRLASTANVSVQSVFAVFRVPSGSHPVSWICTGFFGTSGQDTGLRLNGARTFNASSWIEFGETLINGACTWSFPADTVCVAAFTLNASVRGTTAIGNYWGNASYDRTWWGDIAEIVCYDRLFDADARGEIERHLAAKWGAALPEEPALVNVIPAASAVTVAAGAAIDLAGSDQTFASLAGAGTVRNSASRRATASFADGALEGFEGTLAGNLALRVSGTATLDPAKTTVEPTVDLVLAPGARLDLNGGVLTVRNASGSGLVRNGTLVVLGEDNRRNPATFLILR